MDSKELAKAKWRFRKTVEYIKESVSRGNPDDVPLCFIENRFGSDPATVPDSVFELINFAEDSNDKELCTWLASIDLKPFEEFVKAFLNQAHPVRRDMITDIFSLTEKLMDLRAWWEETQDDGQSLNDCSIACNDDGQVHQESDEANKEAAEFASLFVEVPGNEDVQRASEILKRLKQLPNAAMARAIKDYRTQGVINKDIPVKNMWQWLKGHGYKVVSYQAFNDQF